MASLRLSLIITFFSTNGATVVNFIVTIILARLLSPSEIGIFSVTAVLVSIAHIFRDFGVGSYLLREKELTPQKIRSAIGVLMSTSWLIALSLFLISESAANYYDQPGIKPVMQVLALGFIFIPFGSVTHTLLTREYKAKEQAIVNIAGTTAYAGSSIILAYMDFSYMTMAWANLINIVTTAIAYAPFRGKNVPWLPSFTGWKKVINFGTGTILSNTITSINNALPDVLLGKMSGPHDVGLMSRATSTTNIIMQIAGPTVNYAVLPFLSKKFHAGESLGDPLNKAVAYLTAFAWPAILITAIYAHEIVLVLYGEQWIDCVPIIQIICLTTAIGLPQSFNATAFMATGRPYLALIPGLASFALKITMIWLLYDKTLPSFAYALLGATLVVFPISLSMQKIYLGQTISSYFKAQRSSALVTFICLGAATILKPILLTLPAWATLLSLGLLLIPLWLLSVVKTRHPINHELALLAKRYPLLGKLISQSGN